MTLNIYTHNYIVKCSERQPVGVISNSAAGTAICYPYTDISRDLSLNRSHAGTPKVELCNLATCRSSPLCNKGTKPGSAVGSPAAVECQTLIRTTLQSVLSFWLPCSPTDFLHSHLWHFPCTFLAFRFPLRTQRHEHKNHMLPSAWGAELELSDQSLCES